MDSSKDLVRAAEQAALLSWYRLQKRPLPWRLNRDPYRVWISEAMLQQTTVAAVIPFYERFLAKLPNLDALANAPVETVLELWAGLGYYSRARNLHRSAAALAANGFPQSFEALLAMPGFGPYTARAVASIAFDEPVGALDGNVIRVLSRRYGLALEWWRTPGRVRLQTLADELAQNESPSDWNQAMMELGATVCTPAKPACLLCPWASSCVARKENRVEALPLKRPRKEREIWVWRAKTLYRSGKIALVKNDYAPFLKGHWILPGEAMRLEKKPERFDYRASVTHHDIFVQIDRSEDLAADAKWIQREDLSKWAPASLVHKAFLLNEKRDRQAEASADV